MLVAVALAPPAARATAATNYLAADRILVNHFVSLESGVLHIAPVSPVTVVESSAHLYGTINDKRVPAYAVTNPMGAPGNPNGSVVSCRCVGSPLSSARRWPASKHREL